MGCWISIHSATTSLLSQWFSFLHNHFSLKTNMEAAEQQEHHHDFNGFCNICKKNRCPQTKQCNAKRRSFKRPSLSVALILAEGGSKTRRSSPCIGTESLRSNNKACQPKGGVRWCYILYLSFSVGVLLCHFFPFHFSLFVWQVLPCSVFYLFSEWVVIDLFSFFFLPFELWIKPNFELEYTSR